MTTITVTIKVCVICGAEYATSSGNYFAGRHFQIHHPGVAPQWKRRRETREE